MADKLSILIQSILEAPTQQNLKQVQQQIQNAVGTATSGKGIQLLNKKEIDDYLQKWNNAIARLQINKDKVFANKDVVTELTKMKQLMDGFANNAVPLKDVNLQFDNLKTKVAQVSGSFKNVNHDGYAFVDMISLAAKKIAIWAIGTQLIYGTLRQIKDGISYLVELDNALNQIRIVSGKSQEEVSKLALSYNQLAREMSVTTKEITSAAVEFYRQGLGDAEVIDRLQNTIRYAKISALDFTNSAEILTATVNSMGVEAQRAADVFAFLGDATATGKLKCA